MSDPAVPELTVNAVGTFVPPDESTTADEPRDTEQENN